MTFKAAFLNFWPSADPDVGVRTANQAVFGLQHTDFARRCQRFAVVSAAG
ncbi:hypothetical protein [Bradyrhizobium archetypum]|uniref:Uncharacterized protein n=1 Tax=Bradyrhizobium archetypum TaxID=2721160 RepID=A0A7Y4H5J3_9BRAD|nr:hypothetical protein [Bradyrhizobium archetypum]NOJ47996.1 hypothetical protein [Bradyrhizobium archetypum]